MKRTLLLPSRQAAYERRVYVFLSFLRFLSYALAVALTFIIPKEPPTDLETLLTVSLVGLYTLIKVLFRFRLWAKDWVTYLILGGDLAVSLALVLLTRGVDSPFLLYSLLPVVTAALFFAPRLTLAFAALASLSIILAHTVLTTINPSFMPILESNYLSLVMGYVVFCFILATVTYQANLNVYRRIQSDSIVEERRRLRHEIHDGIAQVLGYLGTKTNLLKKSLLPSEEKLRAELDEIHQTVLESYANIRDDIDLLEAEAESLSLTDELSRHVRQLGERMTCKTEFRTPPELPAVNPVVRLQLLRIAYEALNNVRKHASASQLWVSLENKPPGVELVIKDNGKGFSPEKQKGTGLSIMEERASSVNGMLTITSSPGQGTEVRVRVPRG